MAILSYVLICATSVLFGLVLVIRMRLKTKSNELSRYIQKQMPYSSKLNNRQVKESLLKLNETVFVNIPTDLNNSFYCKVISTTEKIALINHYALSFKNADSIIRTLKIFGITPSVVVSDFVKDFGNIDKLVKQHNEGVIKFLLDTHKDFFDNCLNYPLDKQQRRSIVSEEDNCLVVSSAGSGKTSSIVGKVKYLTEIKGIAPQKILLISYTNKAAAELTERVAMDGLRGYTFHKLAIDIIGLVTGVKPSICDNTDALFVEIYHKLLENPNFKNSIIKYFADYQSDDTEWRQREALSEQKNTKLKAMLPDMDGKTIYVRSVQEQKICFALSSLGVKFRYEEPYEHPLANEMYSQYRPDFSIYFEQNGVTKRIYLEHFGVDEHGLVPDWFAKDKNITYEEANKKYNDGITWKKAAHEKFKTQLLITSSADFNNYDINNIKYKLKELLEGAGVPIQERTDEELYELVLPQGSKQEKAFIRLVVTFVILVKSSCKSVNEVLQQAKRNDDERNVFIIKNIFQPVYNLYVQALRERGQIDFTDAILQATEICRQSNVVEYDYIIVDEFQDISIDRYNFLKALRNGACPAKLYCVGDDWQSIYRFSGSDMALFNQFPNYFGATEINKIETTYRFGEPLVSISSQFIQRNNIQIIKNIHPFSLDMKTDLELCAYDRRDYYATIEHIISSIPSDKSIFLLGRYSFDDYYLSIKYKSVKEGGRFYYIIDGRKIEFLTVHKSKGLESDFVIILQCNRGTYGFPSLISDDSVLNYVLTQGDRFPYGEERRLFYVSITRARLKTFILYDNQLPSVFVNELLCPDKVSADSYAKHPNANKKWTYDEEILLLNLYNKGESIKSISNKMGRSQTSIVMRLNKLNS